MSIHLSNLKMDGLGPITKGVDSARAPYLLDREQLAWLVNGTTRENTIASRPGWSRSGLRFLNSEGQTDTGLQTAFQSGLWQGGWMYEADNGSLLLMCSIAGHIYTIDIDTMLVTDLSTSSGLVNSPVLLQTWWCQAENFMVIQNGEDDALVYDGSKLYRVYGQAKVGPDKASVPIGRMMAYNNGRLWVAVPAQQGDKECYAFVAGDLVYSVTGQRIDVLGFTENTFLNGGGKFVVPTGAGPIRAMSSIAIQDNSTGQGPLQVFTTRGAFSVNAPFDRTEWQNTTSPIQTVSLFAAGATAQFSTVAVNGDIWFRAPDGVRSFSIARRDHGTWVNTPLSNEMKRAFGSDTPALLGYTSATLFDNRLLITTQPYLANDAGTLHGVASKGVGVLDFDPVSSMFVRSQPNWDGVWTGLRILQVLTIGNDNPRCFLFTLNSDFEIELWELSRADRYDSTDNAIEGALETPAYGYDTLGFNLRQLYMGDLWLTQLTGTLNLTIRYRPDTDPNWTLWAATQVCSTGQDCSTPASCGSGPVTYANQYRARLRLPEPSADDCDTANDKPMRLGYRHAVRLEWSGPMALQQLRLTSLDVPEDAVGACPPTECTVASVPLVCINDYSYVTQP